MERAEWLERMRKMSEALYDRFASYYWERWGIGVDEPHRLYLRKFLGLVRPPGESAGVILSAACGAGRFDGLLVEAGIHAWWASTSRRACWPGRASTSRPSSTRKSAMRSCPCRRLERSPAYHAAFDGVICMDAMEHICPEDWPGILRGFARRAQARRAAVFHR